MSAQTMEVPSHEQTFNFWGVFGNGGGGEGMWKLLNGLRIFQIVVNILIESLRHNFSTSPKMNVYRNGAAQTKLMNEAQLKLKHKNAM